MLYVLTRELKLRIYLKLYVCLSSFYEGKAAGA